MAFSYQPPGGGPYNPIPSFLQGQGGGSALQDLIPQPLSQPTTAPPTTFPPIRPLPPIGFPGGSFGGPVPAGYSPAILNQLRSGFQAAGRGDLAGMVGTPAFRTWIGQESGWNPYEVSGNINQGRPNYGLFQFWAGHPWTQQFMHGGQFTASPFQQAELAAKYFHLTPSAIQRYANEIQAGNYPGWG